MKVVKNETFDISKYCGGVILTYLKKDEAKVKPIIDSLIGKGIRIHCNGIDTAILRKPTYIVDILRAIDISACYILVLTEGIFDSAPVKKNIMFQLGYAEEAISVSKLNSKFNPDKIIIVSADESVNSSKLLSGTPYADIQNINSKVDVDNLAKLLTDRYLIEKNSFFDDRRLNELVCKRLKYHRIEFELDVPVDLFFKTYPKGNYEDNLDKLLNKLSSGIRLCSFGNGKVDMTSFIYQKEMNIDDSYLFFPNAQNNFTLKKHYTTKVTKGNLESITFTFEILIPVNRPLGTTYKAFVKASDMESFNILGDIMRANFVDNEEHTYNLFPRTNDMKYKGRFYFMFDFDSENHITLKDAQPEWNIGEKVEYCFPE